MRGYLTSASIVDAKSYSVTYNNNPEGEVLRRIQNDNNSSTGDPFEVWYYFNGIMLGDDSNNGTSDVDYALSIATHITKPGTGLFRNGATSGTQYANFDESYEPINGDSYQATSTSYTVQAGDTLQAIAAALWGDSSFWYLIAQENGLTSSSTLLAGQVLQIPNKVVNIHNTSDTYRVYDPNEAIGNTFPTNPKKPPPKHNGGGCGILGEIFVIIIAVVVTIYSAGTLGPAIASALGSLGVGATTAGIVGSLAGLAIGGAIGSIVSQGAAMAMGMQNKLDWSAVGMSAIASLVGGPDPSADFFTAMAEAAAANVLTQGIGLITGLQRKFDWVEVAAAGAGGGVSNVVGNAIHGKIDLGNSSLNSLAEHTVAGMAGGLAAAATRSLITGTDFGDNIMAVLPSVIGNSVGAALGGKLMGWENDSGSTSL